MSLENIQELSSNTKELIERVQKLRAFHDKSTAKRMSFRAQQELNKKQTEECEALGKKLGVSTPEEMLALLVSRFETSKERVDAYGKQLQEERDAHAALEEELRNLDSEG